MFRSTHCLKKTGLKLIRLKSNNGNGQNGRERDSNILWDRDDWHIIEYENTKQSDPDSNVYAL